MQNGETVTVYFRDPLKILLTCLRWLLSKDGIQSQNTILRNDDGTVEVLSSTSLKNYQQLKLLTMLSDIISEEKKITRYDGA